LKTSRISGFYKLSAPDRLKMVAENAGLSEAEVEAIGRVGLSLDQADKMVENVVGLFQVPLGIATNFLIDGRELLVPMATEEPSVIAAASNGAKMALAGGGFVTSSTKPVMRALIQVTGVDDPWGARLAILSRSEEITSRANEKDPMLVSYGGGVVGVEAEVVETRKGPMVVVHLLVDCRDAMGANAVNTMAEALAPFIEEITGGRVYLRIISNLADLRLARARAVFRAGEIGGPEVVDGIVLASALAESDPYRAATHNKGIMNGVTAVTMATGNDTRAIEAGAHSYAARGGRYRSLSVYEKNRDGDLVGSIELPVAVGTVGGATRVHPVARAAVRVLGLRSADDLGRILASVGLAQNFAALRALATEGIQRGHMSLHARNVAVQAGAVSVQGTMNGYGERCGNCDLTTIIPGLVLKLGYGCSAADSLVHLTEASRLISEIANLAHNERAPYVGDNAFAHKGGIHVSALTRDTRTYEHIDPEQVGNHRKVLISELAGKSNVEFKAREMGITMPGDAQLSKEILKKIKCMEDKGYQFEAAEGSFELIIRRSTREYTPFFILRGFRVITEKTENNALVCEATIKVEVDGIIEHTAANGNGPVDALDNALRKALEKFYPEIGEIKLTDYKVRVLNEKKGTGAAVRVLIDQSRAARHWGTVGVSENIIEASWQALVDGIEYMLLKDRLDGNGGDER